MGSAKSKSSRLARHELLDENDDRYFEKVHARNSTTRSSRGRRGLRKNKKQSQGVHSSTLPDEEMGPTPPMLRGRGNIVGPLKNNTMIDIPPSFARAQMQRRRRKDEERENEMSPINGLPPSPRDEISRSTESSSTLHLSEASPAKKRLHRSQSGQQKGRSSRLSPTSLDTPVSSKTGASRHHVFHDYYTEMMDETYGESRHASQSSARDNCEQAFLSGETASGTIWAETSQEGSKVTSLAFSRYQDQRDDGNQHPFLLAIGSDSGSVRVMEINDRYPSSIVYDELAATSGEAMLSQRLGAALEIQREGRVRSIDFSPNGSWLALGGDDSKASLIKISYLRREDGSKVSDKLQLTHELEREDRVYAVQFSPGGSVLAIGGFDAMVAVATVQESGFLQVVRQVSRSGLVLSVDWSPDGSKLAIAGSDKRCSIVDAPSWKTLGEIERAGSVLAVKWNPEGCLVAVGCHDGTAAVMDASSFRVVHEVARGAAQALSNNNGLQSGAATKACHINSVFWSVDGEFLALGGSDDRCVLVETKTFVAVHEIRRSGQVNSLAWTGSRNEGGRYLYTFLAVGGDDGTVAVVKTGSTAGGNDASSVGDDLSSSASSSYASTISQHEWVLRDDSFIDVDEVDQHALSPSSPGTPSISVITAVCFSRGKRTSPSEFLALSTVDGVVSVFSTKDWEPAAQLKFVKPIETLHFSSQSDFLAISGESGVLHVVDVGTWKVVRETSISRNPIQTVSFSRHDKRLALGSSDGVLTLLDPCSEWNVAGEIDISDSSILSVDWSSKHLAVGREDGTVSVFEAEKVYENFFVSQADLSNGNVPIRSVAFGVRGRYLVVGDDEGKVAVLSAKGGWALYHQITTHASISCASWSSDGRYFGFAGPNTDLRVRVVDTVAWSNVKLEQVPQGHGVSSLDWSNDDRWLVLACTNGASYVIDSKTWLFECTLSSTGSSTFGSKQRASVNQPPFDQEYVSKGPFQDGNEIEPSVVEELSSPWQQRSQVTRFLQVSTAFLEKFDERVISRLLRNRVKCIRMLTLHIKWIGMKGTKDIAFVDGGEHLMTVLRILDVAVAIMIQMLEAAHLASTLLFGLDERDVRSIVRWNHFWRRVDSQAPLIDVDLIRLADRSS